MNSIDVSSLLAEMRSLTAQAQTMGDSAAAGSAAADRAAADSAAADSAAADRAPPKVSFSELMDSSVGSVNEAQGRATELARAFEAGDENVDLAEVMISLQKADLSFKAMTEVRNKLVSAYQEIMNMPV